MTDYEVPGRYQLWHGDCLEEMSRIEAESVDMILADLPYGHTKCFWDTIIPFETLWKQYKRVIKRNGAVALFGSQPFTSLLIMSNPEWFKYCWYWYRNIVFGFLLAKIQPTRAIEEICIFYQEQPIFNRQPTYSRINDRARKVGSPNGRKAPAKTDNHRYANTIIPGVFNEYVAPRNVLEFPCVPRATGTLHPTQKPVALLSYLIKTYTNEGEMVLDNTMGSGSTGEAALRTGRRFIGIEKDAGYFTVAQQRLERVAAELRGELNHLPMFAEIT